MVRSMKDAIDPILRHSPAQQEEFAAFINDELAAEERWGNLLERSPAKLASLAEEGLAEHRRGETSPFESDRDLEDN